MTMSIHNQDHLDHLLAQVHDALARRQPLSIRAGGSKSFLGATAQGQELDVSQHQGIVDYDPSELVVTVRAGTTVQQLTAALDAHQQYLPFEPAHFGGKATVGGLVASGLSGARRPWVGSVRDYVLGCRLITGEGKHLRFGGQVMKNVAGYDVSRLMCGAMGTLGVLTEVSVKLLPQPRRVVTVSLPCTPQQSRQLLLQWQRLSFPVRGAVFTDQHLHIRLEGGHGSVEQATQAIGGEPDQPGFWDDLREFDLRFFHDPRPLWRISQGLQAQPITWPGATLSDWGGAQVWLKSSAPAAEIHALAKSQSGHASLFGRPAEPGAYSPLPAALMRLHQQLKSRLDPKGIFNPGRMYSGF